MSPFLIFTKGKEMEDEEEETETWVNNCYSSSHQILLVGDGDFSFSLSLALAFGSASNIVSTSLDSYDSLMNKYKNAKSNLDQLVNLGASLIHGLDATKMKLHSDLKMRKFDRIVYNFPHAGFHGKEDDYRLIKKHRTLVDGFFRNASGMLRPDGEIHVRHKTSPPFCHWNLDEIASRHFLLLIACIPFKIGDYPGYSNKRGDGLRSDESFPLGECHTFKFILSTDCRKHQRTSREAHHHQSLCNSSREEYHLNSFGLNYLESESNLGSVLSTQVDKPVNERHRAECVWIFDWYFNHVRETFGLPEERIVQNVPEAVRRGYERFIHIDPGRPSSDFIVHLEELHCLSLLRIRWLEKNLAFRHRT